MEQTSLIAQSSWAFLSRHWNDAQHGFWFIDRLCVEPARIPVVLCCIATNERVVNELMTTLRSISPMPLATPVFVCRDADVLTSVLRRLTSEVTPRDIFVMQEPTERGTLSYPLQTLWLPVKKWSPFLAMLKTKR